MKRIICAALAVGLLTAGPLTGRARAEESSATGAADGHKDGKGGDRAEHMEKMLKERLGLSDDQAAKLKASWEAEKAAIKPLREQAKESRRKLEEQVRDLSSDKDIKATLDQIDANRKAMQDERQKAQATVASVLKPYQRAKLRLLMAHMMKGRGHWGHGGRGEGREGGRGEHASMAAMSAAAEEITAGASTAAAATSTTTAIRAL